MKMNLKELREVFSHNKPMNNKVSHFSYRFHIFGEPNPSLSPSLDRNFKVLQATEIGVFTMTNHHFQIMILSDWRIILKKIHSFMFPTCWRTITSLIFPTGVEYWENQVHL